MMKRRCSTKGSWMLKKGQEALAATRKERTHRLCIRGGMLESFLQEPERLTDDDVMVLLKIIFHRQDTQELLKNCWNEEFTKGAIIHHPEVGALRSPKAPRRRAEIFRSHGLLQIIQGTLRFPCAVRFPCAGCRQLPFCGLAIWGHLALQAVPSRQVSLNMLSFRLAMKYNEDDDKSEVMEVKNVFHRRKRLYYANDKRNGKSIIFFNVWEKVCFC